MIEKFTYHEALLGLTYVVGWADGENQVSETDVKVQMAMHEQISPSTISDFEMKQQQLESYESVFEGAIESLNATSKEEKIRACAWMWSVAIVASAGTDGQLDYSHDNWIIDADNVHDEEKKWVDKAISLLGLNDEQVKADFKSLPEIKRISTSF